MSHFYGEIFSKGGKASRCGDKDGMVAHVRGWDVGVFVRLTHLDGEDRVTLTLTGGSKTGGSNGCAERVLGTFVVADLEK